jgi:hypothetical protein
MCCSIEIETNTVFIYAFTCLCQIQILWQIKWGLLLPKLIVFDIISTNETNYVMSFVEDELMRLHDKVPEVLKYCTEHNAMLFIVLNLILCKCIFLSGYL